MTLNEREAFCLEQLPIFKEKYWLPEHFEVLEFDLKGGCFEIIDGVKTDFSEDDLFEIYHRVNTGWAMWKKAVSFMEEKAKAQAMPTWISINEDEPPLDTSVLICWSDSPEVQPEIDHMTCDEDLNHVWANFYRDPPTHWMHFHKVPSESGAEG
ncbi:hypothetical protein [Acinetobacter baumannii]|uniref:hypothetical protein n=1 Tax=Acinetobacter baumannii TaxID=470 RepID=UPI001660F6CA|nr:hypothetical protein [Acinetobacter baumannii]MBD0482850.1 hypothetical protein [Acinetobacter baumannii]MDH2638442.1 hypothetical protein [Acinetobacter baumannii]